MGRLRRIGFAGAGAVGCHYGSKLLQAGFEVLLLARGAHLLALQQHGLSHESGGQRRQLVVDATDDITRLADCDVVLFSSKMNDLEAMLERMQGHLAAGAMLVSLQNGVQAPDMLAAAFPAHTVAAGTAFIGARLTGPGAVMHSAAGGMRLGLWRKGDGDARLSQLISALDAAGVPVRLDADPAAMLWRKLLWNCGFNAITALTRCYARDMAANAETLPVVMQAMQEAVAVGTALGVAVDAADIDKHIAVTLAMWQVKTSMWQDIEAGRACEIDYINGYVATQADQLGLAAPVNRMLSTLVHALDKAG